VVTFTGYQLNGSASAASELCALARLELNTVNGATQRNVAQRQTVTCFDRRFGTGHQYITCSHLVRGDDVATLAVCVQQQGDVCSSVRVIFQSLNLGRNAVLVATEIDNTVLLLVPATDVASCDSTLIVTTTGLGLVCQQRRVSTPFVQLRVYHFHYETAAWRGGFTLNDCHD